MSWPARLQREIILATCSSREALALGAAISSRRQLDDPSSARRMAGRTFSTGTPEALALLAVDRVGNLSSAAVQAMSK